MDRARHREVYKIVLKETTSAHGDAEARTCPRAVSRSGSARLAAPPSRMSGKARVS